jgi:membrane protein DedA with SNARE-associated domain
LTALVSTYIEHFTYLGLFLVLVLCGLGLPVPEDLALLTGGFLIHRGITQYPTTLAVSFVGVLAGDNSLFFLGRRFGTNLLKYLEFVRPRTLPRIERLKKFMDRHGHMAIFYGRFLAGMRALIYVIAGSTGVSPRRFLIYDALGALISVPLAVSIGYLFGDEIESAIRYLGGLDRLILVVAATCIVFYAMQMLPGAINKQRSSA